MINVNEMTCTETQSKRDLVLSWQSLDDFPFLSEQNFWGNNGSGAWLFYEEFVIRSCE